MKELRFAMFGTGFWSRYQLAGWHEIPGAKCVALYNRTRGKAEQLAAEFGVAAVYDDPRQLLESETLDFIDIVTDVGTHAHFTELGAKHRLPIVCQKPMAPSLEIAQRMVDQTRAAGVPLFINENWRWQTPIRHLKSVLNSGRLGPLVRARIDYAHSFPVFENQPFLKQLKQFILTDIGTHILDVSRFLFGEATELVCQTRRMHTDIAGEDVATVLMRTEAGLTVTCNMSYASRWELDRFPETFVAVEGTRGGVSLGPDYRLTIVDEQGAQLQERVPPPEYAWADPAYELIHASIVACQRNLFAAMCGQGQAETTGADNLRTLELVFAAYDSAAKRKVITFDTQ